MRCCVGGSARCRGRGAEPLACRKAMVDRLGRGVVGDRKLVLGHEFPDEGAEFTSNGDNDFLFSFASCFEFDVAFVQTVLHAP